MGVLGAKFHELDEKIRRKILEIEAAGPIYALSPDQRIELSKMLEEWIQYLNPEDRDRRIAAISEFPSEVINVRDLPELVKYGNPTALKLLKVLFFTP
jgi:hypothetical protein